MKENKEKERARNVYAPPCIEVYAAEPSDLMATTNYEGDHQQGNVEGYDASDHQRGDLDPGGGAGAKAMILGQEFSFSDLWEE